MIFHRYVPWQTPLLKSRFPCYLRLHWERERNIHVRAPYGWSQVQVTVSWRCQIMRGLSPKILPCVEEHDILSGLAEQVRQEWKHQAWSASMLSCPIKWNLDLKCFKFSLLPIRAGAFRPNSKLRPREGWEDLHHKLKRAKIIFHTFSNCWDSHPLLDHIHSLASTVCPLPTHKDSLVELKRSKFLVEKEEKHNIRPECTMKSIISNLNAHCTMKSIISNLNAQWKA